MKQIFITVIILMLFQGLFGQSNKLKIAFVCRTDSVFSLLQINENRGFAGKRTKYHFSDSKKINVDTRKSWMHYFRNNLDTTIFEIRVVDMPSEVRDNYFFSTYKYTNGFSHASSKLKDWFSLLYKNEQYDLVIILSKPKLDSRYSEVYELNNHSSYGLIHNKNWIYSLNNLHVYHCNGGKIIAQSKLKSYNNYLRILKGDDLSKIEYAQIGTNDIKFAIDEIIKINNDMGHSVIKKIIKQSKRKTVKLRTI